MMPKEEIQEWQNDLPEPSLGHGICDQAKAAIELREALEHLLYAVDAYQTIHRHTVTDFTRYNHLLSRYEEPK